MAVHKKYPALGRGLDLLMRTDEVHTGGSSSINEVAIAAIKANPNQPRREFDEEALKELADSIREIGIIQPITVRDMGDGSFVIIAGERRWRASQMAGLTTIPAYIRTVNDENMMEMALVENIQRENLNSMEIALAYQHLIEQYNLTQERLSERVGKNRSTVTNYLRLLKLPATIQMGLKNHTIEMGHARALLALDDPTLQLKVYDEIQRTGLSVRKVEEMTKSLMHGESVTAGGKRLRAKGASSLPVEFGELKEALSSFFQTKVQLTCSDKGRGKISIPFANEKELERIIDLFDSLKH
ncbi:MAG: ParB/RepB/Spo0J family partition protein [Bacteroidaceae bacterium]|nr:ParB/RepB/Spo0J family partition protein [Bacteroidaceae bacterium]MBR1788255.1 ParB/RepB/Spo0J family partition protein [Bacteroidaceae bacterium]